MFLKIENIHRKQFLWNQDLFNFDFDDNKIKFRINDYISSMIMQDNFQSDNYKDKSSQKEIMKKKISQREVFFKTQAS